MDIRKSNANNHEFGAPSLLDKFQRCSHVCLLQPKEQNPVPPEKQKKYIVA